MRRAVAGGAGSGEGYSGAGAANERGGRAGRGHHHMRSGAVLKEEGTVPPMPPDVKEEGMAPPMPPGTFFKEEGVVPPMPPDAAVKQEHEDILKEKGRSQDGRPKRQRRI